MPRTSKARTLWDIRVNESQLVLARLLTVAQNERSPEVKKRIRRAIGNALPMAHIIGVTGGGGVGKSTLINRVLARILAEQKTVVVLAIDPSSEKNKGAVLGDRIRMYEHHLKPGVFIRSIASRGARGGLARGLSEMIRASSVFCDFIIVETAGAGQGDTGISKLVNTLVVVLDPLGDAITMMKAGQTEHAHIITVNCRKGLPNRGQDVREMLEGEIMEGGWKRKVFIVDAQYDEGIDEFFKEGLLAHQEFFKERKSTGVGRQ